MRTKNTNVEIDYSKVSGGLNTTEDPTAIRDSQAQDCENAIILDRGWKRSPGFKGLKTSEMFNSAAQGLFVYERNDGTETLLSVSGGKLYTVDQTTGDTTELYDMGGSGEAWFTNWRDKCWVCNGSKLVKVESASVAYQVGIDAPASGPSVSAVSGGSLADGTYSVYIGYARKVSGTNVLYSGGLLLGDVVISGSNKTIRISDFANSTDAQVNNKVVWVQEPSGSVYYFYHETGDNTTTTVDVSSNTNKNTSLLFSINAASNLIVSSPQYCHMHDRRLWVAVDNRLYYSLQSGTVYDLEKFDTVNNYIDYPYVIKGLFTHGEHLYINTPNGIIRQPYGDVGARYEMIASSAQGLPVYFKEFRTVDAWGSYTIGLTNDGVRFFNGQTFVQFDLSRDIKPDIQRLYNGSTTAFRPCGCVHRRSFRTEYLLSYRDLNDGGLVNNRTLVLNLDSFIAAPNAKNYQSWERWKTGFSYMATKKDNTIYYCQSKDGGSNICAEDSTSTADQYIYNSGSLFLVDSTNKRCKVVLKERIVDIGGRVRWNTLHHLLVLRRNAYVKLVVGDVPGISSTRTINASLSDVPVFGAAVFGAAVFPDEGNVVRKVVFPKKCHGRSVYIEIYQDDDDTTFNVLSLILRGVHKITRFT